MLMPAALSTVLTLSRACFVSVEKSDFWFPPCADKYRSSPAWMAGGSVCGPFGQPVGQMGLRWLVSATAMQLISTISPWGSAATVNTVRAGGDAPIVFQ